MRRSNKGGTTGATLSSLLGRGGFLFAEPGAGDADEHPRAEPGRWDADERGRTPKERDPDMTALKHEDITGKVLHAFYKKVYPQLGYGFLEKVYENALALELRRMGLRVEQQARIDVFYDGALVGQYFADLLVEGAVILELKAVERLAEEHKAQLLNYLRATPYEVGLLLNFGPRPEHHRKAFDNERKPSITWRAQEDNRLV